MVSTTGDALPPAAPSGPTPDLMLTVAEARDRILADFSPLPSEQVPVLDALGRVLAEDVVAPNDVPPFDNSAMDGYAVRAADVKTAREDRPVMLAVLGELPAGVITERPVEPNTCYRILTGAPLPPGADSVVPYELTDGVAFGGWHGEAEAAAEIAEQGTVRIFKGVEHDDNVRHAAEDLRQGDVILRRGAVIRPAEVGVLASLGRTSVELVQRPRVAILSTGDEVIEIDRPLEPGLIRNSNSYSLAALVRWYGGEPLMLGIAADTVESLREHLRRGRRADVIVTTGGVSMGDYDVVKNILAHEGDVSFWSIDMRPGKPLAFGSLLGVPFVGLPGNPVSTMVGFEILVRPAMLKLAGHTRWEKTAIRARSAHRISNRSGRENYMRATVTQDGDEWSARLTGEQGSGILTSMHRANGLVVVPRKTTRIEKGESVHVLMLDWPSME
ncbi:MAG: molybdopterin molybdenumtransferase MoeA [Dehalococcoidia bacterium]|nr:molybdopterin molybdenumtransferase MoeA [Dehalococcoidia bacterium]